MGALLQDGTHARMSDMSVWWMAIPYAMIGIGEILVNTVLQHTAYEGAPESMRSFLQACNLFAMGGMPNAISAGISLATKRFTPDNLNDGSLWVAYAINCAICAVGMWRRMRRGKAPTTAKDPGREMNSPLWNYL